MNQGTAGVMNIIPREQLSDLGFEEIQPKLFKKHITPVITFFRDYRSTNPVMYAYDGDKKTDPSKYKEYRAILKIEHTMSSLQRGNQSYFMRSYNPITESVYG